MPNLIPHFFMHGIEVIHRVPLQRQLGFERTTCIIRPAIETRARNQIDGKHGRVAIQAKGKARPAPDKRQSPRMCRFTDQTELAESALIGLLSGSILEETVGSFGAIALNLSLLWSKLAGT